MRAKNLSAAIAAAAHETAQGGEALADMTERRDRAIIRGIAYMAAVEQLYGPEEAERVASLAEKYEKGMTEEEAFHSGEGR